MPDRRMLPPGLRINSTDMENETPEWPSCFHATSLVACEEGGV